MTYRGKVQQGVVVLEGGARLPEGAEVEVIPVEASSASNGDAPPAAGETLAQRLLKFAGAAEGLPSDFARNHDHYVHGSRVRAPVARAIP